MIQISVCQLEKKGSDFLKVSSEKRGERRGRKEATFNLIKRALGRGGFSGRKLISENFSPCPSFPCKWGLGRETQPQKMVKGPEMEMKVRGKKYLTDLGLASLKWVRPRTIFFLYGPSSPFENWPLKWMLLVCLYLWLFRPFNYLRFVPSQKASFSSKKRALCQAKMLLLKCCNESESAIRKCHKNRRSKVFLLKRDPSISVVIDQNELVLFTSHGRVDEASYVL